MPRIQQPYYNVHQITTGQYTSGDEYVLQSGEIYIGPYHILPNGQRFTGFRPEDNSVELLELRLFPTADMLRYNMITGNEANRYTDPNPVYPSPTEDDYKIGQFERYFIQKRTSPHNTIIEIDSTQFNQVNTLNNPGLNGAIWNKVKIIWKISKIPAIDADYLNRLACQRAEPAFPGVSSHLRDGLEFFR